MALQVIVACDIDGLIGIGSDLPWRCREDMQHFKTMTMGSAVLMGRKTAEGLPGPLKNRLANVVVTQHPERSVLQEVPGFTLVESLDRGLQSATAISDDVFVIGGGEVYRQVADKVDIVHLTFIHDRFAKRRGVDMTYFPLEDYGIELGGEKVNAFARIDPARWTIANTKPMQTRPGTFFELHRVK